MARLPALRGPFSGLGLGVAAIAFLLDQGHKTWMIHVYRIEERRRVEVAPFLDLVLTWNTGVSYGLLRQDGAAGRLALIVFALCAVVFMVVWLARLASGLPAIALGLIMGGAIGNAVDRAVYGAVADFFYFHWGNFTWYVFNVADVAIVAGIIGLVYDLLTAGHKRVPKTP